MGMKDDFKSLQPIGFLDAVPEATKDQQSAGWTPATGQIFKTSFPASLVLQTECMHTQNF